MAETIEQAHARAPSTSRVLGFDGADLRALGIMALGALVIIPTAAYLLGGVRFGPRDWAPGLDLARLWEAGPVVLAHIGVAVAALMAGMVVLGRRKGAGGHRFMGRLWVALMLGTAITGIAIEPLRFSPAHGAALLVFAMVPLAIRKVRRGDLRGHRRAMAQLLIALAIVGLLALCPDSCCIQSSSQGLDTRDRQHAMRPTPIAYTPFMSTASGDPATDNRSPFGDQWWAAGFSLAGCAALIDPVRRGASPMEWTLTIAGVLAFVGIFVSVLLDWKRGRSGLWQTAAITMIGAAFAPFNSAGWVFLVVVAAFAASVAVGQVRKVALIVGGVITIALIEQLVLRLPWSFLAAVAGCGIPTAIMTTLTLRRSMAVRELARHGERERIARDMHDVLGHTLSVIILKTDLAARLAHRDPDRTVRELSEVDRIARETLDEVRETIRGYRAKSLEHEIELARHTLTIAGIGVNTEFKPPRLDPAQENVLCLALREAVTNIVRHARARHCRLAVTVQDGNCVLEIADDGEGASPTETRGKHQEGAGLSGMRERVVAGGGSITHCVDRGTKLTIRLPWVVAPNGTGSGGHTP